MKTRMMRLCAIAVAAALAATFVPAAVLAAPRDPVAAKASRHRGFRAAALTAGSATYAPDPNDSTDDTWTAAFDVAGTLGLPEFTGSYEATARAFYKGDVASGGRLEASNMGVASGAVFADALAGGSFAGFAGVPVILTPGGAISRWIYDKNRTLPAGKTDWLTDVRMSGEQSGAILRSYVFGGAGTVSDAVLRDLDHITGPGPLL